MLKKTFLFISLIFFSCISFSQRKQTDVGIIKDGVLQLTFDVEQMKTIFDNYLAQQKISTHIVGFKIIKDTVSGTKDSIIFMLLGYNELNDIKVGVDLVLKADILLIKA